jgi:CRISPR-associated endonuclease/helicase Cas3
MNIDFPAAFEALTSYQPCRWQQRLFEQFASGNIPDACDIPTGLGKTSVIPIWLVALATQVERAGPEGATLPRRLVYVVNRRTVVDQATDVAIKIREILHDSKAGGSAEVLCRTLQPLCIDPDDPSSPVAISTLRGELADNREWQADPARPAIIVGTIDMIGSRLLFSGYGVSRRMRPFHAGLIGQECPACT